MNARFFVIGSNSFSGASFVSHALKAGATVMGVSRSPEPHIAFLPYRWNQGIVQSNKFCFEQLDMNHDSDRIVRSIKDFQAEYVINFAAQSMVAESWIYPEQWYQTNVMANVRLHEKIRQFDLIKKYVHVSTPEVYGSCGGNI